VKLNIACGKQTWNGYFCVDAVAHPKATRPPDLLHAFTFDKDGALLNPLPLPDNCADELCNFHFIEHVYAWEAPAIVSEFRRLLKPGGRLVMELPDINKAANNLLHGGKDQLCMWPLYGDPGTKDPYMCHRWGYTPKTIKQLLEQGGFIKVHILPPKTHGARGNRDMRVEAVR
jgi:predicted SAM-dependent methyltransferase